MQANTSFFDRVINRAMPAWIKLLISLLMFSLPFAAAYLDGRLAIFLHSNTWRVFLIPPAIIIYIWWISPIMERMGAEVLRALRPLALLEAQDFDRIVSQAERLNPAHEWIALGIGGLLGLLASQPTSFDAQENWLKAYWGVSSVAMYSFLAWAIFAAVANTRLNATLLRQPMRIDILDTKPFESVGRQSLVLALVFIGGISLSLLLSLQVQDPSSPLFWLSYGLPAGITLLIFFLNMRPTHRLLAAEKNRELEPLQRRIRDACRELAGRVDQRQEASGLSAEINALAIYEQRLLAARTWPYNTGMLRTLFFSVFIPLSTVLLRVLIELMLK